MFQALGHGDGLEFQRLGRSDQAQGCGQGRQDQAANAIHEFHGAGWCSGWTKPAGRGVIAATNEPQAGAQG